MRPRSRASWTNTHRVPGRRPTDTSRKIPVRPRAAWQWATSTVGLASGPPGGRRAALTLNRATWPVCHSGTSLANRAEEITPREWRVKPRLTERPATRRRSGGEISAGTPLPRPPRLAMSATRGPRPSCARTIHVPRTCPGRPGRRADDVRVADLSRARRPRGRGHREARRREHHPVRRRPARPLAGLGAPPVPGLGQGPPGADRRRIPAGWRVCGENMYARHSIAYEDLDSWFYGFSVWDRRALPGLGPDRRASCGLGVPAPPVLWRGHVRRAGAARAAVDPARQEGYVVRTVDGFAARRVRAARRQVGAARARTDRHALDARGRRGERARPGAALWAVRSGAAADPPALAAALGAWTTATGGRTAEDGRRPLAARLECSGGPATPGWPAYWPRCCTAAGGPGSAPSSSPPWACRSPGGSPTSSGCTRPCTGRTRTRSAAPVWCGCRTPPTSGVLHAVAGGRPAPGDEAGGARAGRVVGAARRGRRAARRGAAGAAAAGLREALAGLAGRGRPLLGRGPRGVRARTDRARPRRRWRRPGGGGRAPSRG